MARKSIRLLLRDHDDNANMPIVVIRYDDRLQEWVQGLRKVAGKVDVYAVDEPHPIEDICMAVVWGRKHPPSALQRYPRLLGVQSMGAGVEFLLDGSVDPSIKIMRVIDDNLASDMAEFALATTLAALKQLPTYKQAQVNREWTPVPYRRARDTTVGILGCGALGMAVADLLQRVGFTVLGWTRSSRPEAKFDIYTGNEQQQDFLKQSQVLICLVPLTPATQGLLNRQTLAQLPRGAVLVNLARGPILVDDDLVEALDSGHLSGAYLDVFTTEPLPTDHPFWWHPKVHVTPHVASVTDIASSATQMIDNYHALVEGRPLKGQVCRDRGY